MEFQDLPDELLSQMNGFDDHECVRRFELGSGIVAFIALHNTNLGPALGGLRMRAYENEAAAIQDVLRLSKGMTYKNAMAGLPLGGGKAVIIGNPFQDKSADMMRAMGRAVESFEGAYITAEDSGTTEEDMVHIAQETDHVTGLPPQMLKDSDYGELGGNPSPLTALGCFHGIKAAVAFHTKGTGKLNGMTAAVQGVGAVGLEICQLLQQENVKLMITDVNDTALKQAQASLKNPTVVKPDDIYAVEADIFVPCALGGVLNDQTIPQLKCDIIAGMANNQLASDYHDQMLHDRAILYVPDYVINAGGVICVGYEYFRKSGYNPQDFIIDRSHMVSHVERIGQSVTQILTEAHKRGLTTGSTADQLAEEKFLKGAALNDKKRKSGSATQEDFPSYALSAGTKLVQ